MWLRYVIVKPIGFYLAAKPKYNLEHTGEENAPYKGPFIVLSNHQTGVDVFAVGLSINKVMNRSRMLPWAKTEIKKGKEGILGWLLWYWLGTIPIDRDAVNEAPKAIRRSLDYLRKGKIIFVHPEGTRYPAGQLGPFMFGLANLARAVPVPILPVGVWRRLDGDGGIQVSIGVPFFMPPYPHPEDEGEPETVFRRRVEGLKEWSENLDRDKKGMKMMARMIDLVLDAVTKMEQKITHEKMFRVAHEDDNEFLRDKVFELLPDSFRKVDKADWSEAPPALGKHR
ncbi:MAG: 1-acyl-sn-glycerol-3-phosphate acyltransferase [Actinobacteria bacterium]|nr:1-acyl-sn-glycerol-3-phosphate acyltransferase [Actinomycetota bacterium]MBU1944174.1 1-acyl-sn-glycerol-3-phosphate acyltransferase [Actinomycetota bacterium]MBU2687493.1 1-acyl-sn-glycerol-3-phosphate acyltransferase [Actinomycetota bacterium]